MTYVALIGDIVGSRKIASRDREAVQEKIGRAIDAVNNVKRADIDADFILTTGDEFQGLLPAGADAFWFVRNFQLALPYEVRLRFGVGRGELVTALKEKAVGMDGPCFHNARDAIDRAKSDDVTCRAAGFGDFDLPLNVLLESFYTLYWHLTKRKREIYDRKYFFVMDPPEIRDVFGYKTPRYIYRVLDKYEIRLAAKLEAALREIFTRGLSGGAGY